MKINCVMFCMMIIHIVSNSQTLDVMQREYGYDASGNRILRKIVEIPEQKSFISDKDTIQTQELVQDSIKKGKKYYIDELGNLSLKVFPNPTTSIVNIDILNINTQIEGNIMLYSASGALLANKQINTSHIELDVSTYSKGNYFAVILGAIVLQTLTTVVKHIYYIKKCIRLISLSLLLLLVSNVNKLKAQIPVGTLPGTIDVTPTGMASYSIPIDVVPGTQGMQPNLSIVYNSQGGNGVLGMKWDIAGLSAITRATQTLYHDNNISAIKMNNNDRFVLDGNRLMVTNNEPYGSTDAIYGTEIETFSRIISHGILGNGPDYFQVIQDDGTVIDYGGTGNSKQNLNGTASVWMINKIIDIHGNYMTFSYIQDYWTPYISEIYYTSNDAAGLSSYAKVTFTYIDNNATKDIDIYINGTRFRRTKLLQKITVYYNNTTVREYTFTYSQNNQYALLTHITLSDENAVSLNPTVITWGNEGATKTIKEINTSTVGPSIIGDFNGDGIKDFIFYNRGSGNNRYLEIFCGDINGKFNLYKKEYYNDSITPGYVADIDGDYIDEFFHFKDDGTLYYWNFKTSPAIRYNIPNSIDYDFSKPFPVGDLNGDGNADIIALKTFKEKKTSYVKIFCYLNINSNPITLPNRFGSDKILFYSTDFNGDGKTDILITDKLNCYVYEFQNNTSSFSPIETEGFLPTYWHRCFFGDFNGDGIQDLLSFSKNSLKWFIHLGTGKGYAYGVEQTLLDSLPNTYKKENYENPSSQVPIIGDLDGDGKDDITQIKNGVQVNIFLTRTISWEQYTYEHIHSTKNWTSSSYKSYSLGDMNFDGKLDLIYRCSYYISLYAKGESNYVKKITNGLGFETEINYSYLTLDDKSVKNKISYPIVRSIKQSNGIGNNKNEIFYSYLSPVYSFKRKAFLGFEEFYINSNGFIKKYKFAQNAFQRQMYLSEYFKYIWNAKPLRIINIEYQKNNIGVISMGNKRFIMFNIKTENIDYLNNNYQYIERQLYRNSSFKGRDSIITVSYKSQQGISVPYDIKKVQLFKYKNVDTYITDVGEIVKIDSLISTEEIAGNPLIKKDLIIYNYDGHNLKYIKYEKNGEYKIK